MQKHIPAIFLLFLLSACDASSDLCSSDDHQRFSEYSSGLSLSVAPNPTKVLIPLQVSGALAQPVTDGSAPTWNGTHWNMGATTSPLRYSVPLQVGDEFVQVIVYGRRLNNAADSTATIEAMDVVIQTPSALSVPVVAADPNYHNYVALDVTPFSNIVINEDMDVSVAVRGNGISGDYWSGATFYVLR